MGNIMKKGRFSNEEMDFIEANAEVLSPDQMAVELDRDPASVRDWIKKNIGFSPKQKKEAAVANELKSKPYFKELSHQFTSEELEMFHILIWPKKDMILLGWELEVFLL